MNGPIPPGIENPGRMKALLRWLIGVGLAVCMGMVFSVPFRYETETLWYKIGFDKTILRAGQLAGLLTLIQIVLQFLFVVRIKFLHHLYGTPNLVKWHRINGILLAGTASSHLFLVLFPEGFDNLPIGMKYWPELLGGLTFLLLQITIVLSRFRSALGMAYSLWKKIHAPLAYLIAVLASIHVLFVSESFAQGLPRTTLLAVFSCMIALVFSSKIPKLHK